MPHWLRHIKVCRKPCEPQFDNKAFVVCIVYVVWLFGWLAARVLIDWMHTIKGMGPNVQRAILVGVSQPPSYDEAKHLLISWGIGGDHALLVHAMYGMLEGLVAVVLRC
jgi:hypothetical protein